MKHQIQGKLITYYVYVNMQFANGTKSMATALQSLYGVLSLQVETCFAVSRVPNMQAVVYKSLSVNMFND